MLEQFLNHIKNKKLVSKEEKVLLTVSGGIDSMTMLDLFMHTGFQIAVAHCNFQLRGNESDGDQEFIEEFCKSHQIQIFTKRFDTKKAALDLKISIQMAARELRYEWFQEVAKLNDYQKIAVAHNLNDLAETFLINLSRGTGIRGLSGIKVLSGNIIRPLLFASRSEIELYANEKSVLFREDSSNLESKYLRNKIRHEVIPVFLSLNPSFLESMENTTSVLYEAEKVLDMHVAELSKALLKQEKDTLFINKEQLMNLDISPAILYEILLPFNFTYDTAFRLLSQIQGNPGLQFYSSTYKLVNDRENFIIQELKSEELVDEYLISDKVDAIEFPLKLRIFQHKNVNDFLVQKVRNVATFDLDKVIFPLVIRKWRNGDYFYPYGMKGRKKLSDYFTDHKFSLIDKENCWVLCSGVDIIWIINHRADNRYCITENTRNILEIIYSDKQPDS